MYKQCPLMAHPLRTGNVGLLRYLPLGAMSAVTERVVPLKLRGFKLSRCPISHGQKGKQTLVSIRAVDPIRCSSVPTCKTETSSATPWLMTICSSLAEGLHMCCVETIPGDAQVVVVGREAYLRMQQTMLGLFDASRKKLVVRDALGSRHSAKKEAAIRRMERGDRRHRDCGLRKVPNRR